MPCAAPLRSRAEPKGWCPGVLRPMAAKDGLLVRLRLTGGILSATAARVVADLSRRHGNGLIDLSSRGNLQLRGVSEASWAALVEDLRAVALVDDDPAAEAVRNVVASPLAGLHDGIDIRPVVRALETALSVDPALHELPAKFGFLVDDGALPSLACVPADVRFDWSAAEGAFSIGLGGTRTDAARIGTCPSSGLVDWARRIGSSIIVLGRGTNGSRRLHGIIERHGREAVAAACGGTLQPVVETPHDSAQAPNLVGAWQLSGVTGLGLAAPFGRLDEAMLRAAARHACHELRLTPWRTILLPGAAADMDCDSALRSTGFILDPNDARLGIVACVGRDGCASGTTPTRADATRLATLAAATRTLIHVSGCSKGCAHAASAPITLVGRDGRYDLVREGRANDMPTTRDLDLAAVQALLSAQRVGDPV